MLNFGPSGKEQLDQLLLKLVPLGRELCRCKAEGKIGYVCRADSLGLILSTDVWGILACLNHQWAIQLLGILGGFSSSFNFFFKVPFK